MSLKKPLCIFHSQDGHQHCDDGFASAWIVNRLKLGYEFHYGIYQQDPPDVTDRDVLLVDFSYKREVLEKMAEQAESVVILDHHKSARDDLAGIPEPIHFDYWNDGHPRGLFALFDMERSGAGITWDYFYPGQNRPEFINYIEDRDLWIRKQPGSDYFTMALRSYPQDFYVWTGLSESVERLIEEGRSIHRYYRTLIDAFKKNATEARIGGVLVPVVNTPFQFASELAGELAEDAPFAACYWFHAHGCTFSLRSRKDGEDVSEIAKKYGGGGHPGAAGFKLTWEEAWKIISN